MQSQAEEVNTDAESGSKTNMGKETPSFDRKLSCSAAVDQTVEAIVSTEEIAS